MRRTIFLPQFVLDIEQARQWYNGQRWGLGDEVAQAADEAIAFIQKTPLAHAMVDKELRRYVVSRFKHVVLYAADDDYLFFTLFVHGARDVARILKRRTRR